KRQVKRNGLLDNFYNNELEHIGGSDSVIDNEPKYVENQKKIINNRSRNVPKSFKPPYDDMYLYPYDFKVYNEYRNLDNNNNNSIHSLNENTEEQRHQEVERYNFTTDYLYRNGLID